MIDLNKIELLVTHSEKFHADDVLSTALLDILSGRDIEVIRIDDVEDPSSYGDNVIIFDIGGGEFDHHQSDAETNVDGIKKCSFQLLVEHFEIEELRSLAIDVSRQDTAGRYLLLSEIITSYNSSWDSTESKDDAFKKAVSMSKEILACYMKGTKKDGDLLYTDEFLISILKEIVDDYEEEDYSFVDTFYRNACKIYKMFNIDRPVVDIFRWVNGIDRHGYNWFELLYEHLSKECSIKLVKEFFLNKFSYFSSLCRADEEVVKLYDNQKNFREVVILPKWMPITTFLENHPEIRFTIYPSRNGFVVSPVRFYNFELRCLENKNDIPEDWRDHGDDEEYLSNIVKGLSYVHEAGFLCVADSQESAIETAYVIMNFYDTDNYGRYQKEEED